MFAADAWYDDAYVSQTAERQAIRVVKAYATHDEQQHTEQYQQHIQADKREHCGAGGRTDYLPVHAYRKYGVGVQDASEFSADALGEDGDAAALHGAARRTAHGTEIHGERQYHPHPRLPLAVVAAGKARRCLRGDNHKERIANGFTHRVAIMHNQSTGDNCDKRQDREEIPSELCTAEQTTELATDHEQVYEGIVDASHEHEQGKNPFDAAGVEGGNAGVSCGKTSRRNGGEGMAEGFERLHA